jgi:predicted RecB family nuclease
MNEFSDFLASRNYPKIYYWSAEPSIWKRAEIRNSREKLNLKWCDLYQLFKGEPIVIRGCFDFSLKSIAKAMHRYGMISTSLESNCNSGMVAMLNCWKYYNQGRDEEIIQDTIRYNEFDCKVLYEILEFLRTNML